MDWNDLLKKIQAMPAEARKKPVRFRTPWDDFDVFAVTDVAVAEKKIDDDCTEDPILPGEHYLFC